MKHLRKAVVIAALALWGASMVYIWSPQFLNTKHQVAHAQAALTVSAAVSGNTVTVTWSTFPGFVDHYSISRDSAVISQTSDALTTSFVDPNPPAGSHTYTVTALDNTFTTLATGTSAAVVVTAGGTSTTNGGALGVTVSASGKVVTVKWNVITNAVHYDINRNGTAIGSSVSGSVTTFPDTNPPDGTYTYGVAAIAADSSTLASGSAATPVVVALGVATVGAAAGPAPAGGAAAGGVNSPLAGSCDQANTGAQAAAAAAPATVTQNLYEILAQDGVKTVFRWVLSLVNLLVLVFLLAVAFANILRLQINNFAVQKVFVPLIMGVLLANFSWLICRFFIELSTILYTSLTGTYGGGAGLFKAIATRGYGLDQLCRVASGADYASGLLGVFIGTVLIVVAGILILTLYILLVARVWIVTLLVILSPLAFLALGFPMTSQLFKKWWTTFFNWVFMAPASFLILVLAYQMTSIGTGPNLTKYILVTALLYYAIQVPFKMGGEWMTKWGGYVSQFKKGSVAVADRATKATRQEYGQRLATAFNNRTPMGRYLQTRKASIELTRKRVQENLEASRSAGARRLTESKGGTRGYTKLGEATQRSMDNEEAVKVATGEGVIRAQLSGTQEAQTINLRLAEYRARQAAVAKELKGIESRSDVRFGRTNKAEGIEDRVNELDHEAELLKEQIEKQQKESQLRYVSTNPAAKIIEQEIDQLQKQNIGLQRTSDRIKGIFRREFRERDALAEKERLKKIEDLTVKLRPYQEKINEAAIKKFGPVDVPEASARAELRKQFERNNSNATPQAFASYERSDQGKKDLVNVHASMKKARRKQFFQARREGLGLTDTEMADFTNTQKELKDAKQAKSGSILAQAALSEKRAKNVENRLIKYEEQAQANASMRVIRENPLVAQAQNAVTIQDTKLQAMANDPSRKTQMELRKNHEKDINDNKKIRDTRLSVLRENIWKENITESQKQQKLQDTIQNLPNDPVYLQAEQKILSSQNALQRINVALDPQYKAEEANLAGLKEELKRAQVRASQKTPEAIANVISTLDSLAEDTSEINGWFSQSQIGKVVDAKRATWRNFVATNEQIADRELQLAFYNFYRVGEEGERIAKLVGRSIEDYKEIVDNHNSARIRAQEYKELTEAESKKGMRVVLEQVMRAQNRMEDMDEVNGKLDIANKQVATLQDDIKRAQDAGDAALVTSKQTALNRTLLKYTKLMDDKTKKEQATATYIASIKEQYGDRIEAMPYYLQEEFLVDKQTGEWTINRNFRTGQEKYRARRLIDRRIGLLGTDIDSSSSARSKNRTPSDLLREWYGRGNDVKRLDIIQAMLAGDQEKVNAILVEEGWDYRVIEKAASFNRANLLNAKDWDKGSVQRNAFFSDIAPPELLERLVFELAENEQFKKNNPANPVVEASINEMQTNAASGRPAKMSEERLAELRESLRSVSTRQHVNSLMASVDKVLPPDSRQA